MTTTRLPTIAAALAALLSLGSVLPGPWADEAALTERGTVVRRGSSPPPGCWVRGDREDLELRISRLDSAAVAIGGDTVKVCYSRPRKLGRPIMGRLVPYGEPWRLGANEATAIHVPFPAKIAGVTVEPGWYSLYAVPRRENWTIVVNEEGRRWGIPIDEEVRGQNVGSGTVPARELSETVKKLTMELRTVSANRARLRIRWERIEVRVPVLRLDSVPGREGEDPRGFPG